MMFSESDVRDWIEKNNTRLRFRFAAVSKEFDPELFLSFACVIWCSEMEMQMGAGKKRICDLDSQEMDQLEQETDPIRAAVGIINLLAKSEQSNKRRLPPPTGPSGQKFGVTLTSYTVGSWCPTPDGSGPAVAVALELATELNGQPMSFFLRLHTPESVDTMIQSLLRHKRDVFPEAS